MSSYVKIFDTTLRDGEQSPGAFINLEEKFRLAHKLTQLGVDVIEVGFLVFSPSDLESVKLTARHQVEGPIICGLAYTPPRPTSARPGGQPRTRPAPHPHLYCHQRDSHAAQTAP